MALPQERIYTTEDIYALSDGQRAELIDGHIYSMAPPSAGHQEIIFSLARKIADYIDEKKGDCKIYLAPYGVFLNADDKNYVEPDISIICDKSKLNDRGCIGAPDWIIEVVSPRTERIDYGIKLFKYRSAGVREYWIINQRRKSVMVYDLEKNEKTNLYSFEDDISVCIYEDFSIKIEDIYKKQKGTEFS